jgi:phosphotransferase system HPr (HPr) family protein
MNSLRERYEKDHLFFLTLDPHDEQDQADMRSFAEAHFQETLETRIGKVEIIADLEGSLDGLDAYMMIKFHNGDEDRAVYFKDPGIWGFLSGMGPGEMHIYVGGADLEEALLSLKQKLGIGEQEVHEAPGLDDYSEVYVVNNPGGIDDRSASAIAELASRYDVEVEVTSVTTGKRANGKSIVELLGMGAKQQTPLIVKATGSDYQEFQKQMGDLINHGFYED